MSVLPMSRVPFHVTSGPAMMKTGPVIVPGSPKAEAVSVWFGLGLQVSLPANRSRVVSRRDHASRSLGLPGAASARMTVTSSVRFVRL